ncbi:unknown [Clostridium sp. CAG:1193]|nr:unknown [Clostridium sp. CAG:1193]
MEEMEIFDDIKSGSSKNGLAVAIIGILVLLILGGLGIWYYTTNKADVMINKIIDKVFDGVTFKNEENSEITYDLSLNIKSENLESEALDIINNTKIKGSIYINSKDKYTLINLGATYEDKELLSFDAYYNDNTIYLQEKSIYDKYVSINVPEELQTEINNMYTINEKDINIVKKGIKNALKNALKEETFIKEKVDTNINGKNTKANSLKLIINDENRKEILTKISKYLKDNDEFLDSMSNLTDSTSQEIFNSLESLTENYTNTYTTTTIILYTTGITNELAKVDIKSEQNEKEVSRVVCESDTCDIQIINDGEQMNMNILMNETSSTIKINGKMGEDDVSLTLNLKGNYNKKDAPKINESVNIDEISEEDMNTIMTNLGEKEEIKYFIEKIAGGNIQE